MQACKPGGFGGFHQVRSASTKRQKNQSQDHRDISVSILCLRSVRHIDIPSTSSHSTNQKSSRQSMTIPFINSHSVIQKPFRHSEAIPFRQQPFTFSVVGRSGAAHLPHPATVDKICHDLDAKHRGAVLLAGPGHRRRLHVLYPGVCPVREKEKKKNNGSRPTHSFTSSTVWGEGLEVFDRFQIHVLVNVPTYFIQNGTNSNQYVLHIRPVVKKI